MALAHAYNQQAGNYVWDSKQDTALMLYFKAVNICKTIKADEALFYSYIGVAYLYETTGALDKSLDYCRKALQLSETLSNKNLSAFAYHEMASICMGLGNDKDAYNYFWQAKERFALLNNKDRIASCCSDLSRLFIDKKLYPQAQEQLDSALAIFRTLDEPIQEAEVYEGYGLLYTQMKQFEQAESNYNNALQIYQGNKMDDDGARIQMNIGKMLLQKNDYSEAKTLLNNVFDYYKNTNNKEGQLEVILPLAMSDSMMGVHLVQYNYLSIYKDLSDSINMERTAQRTREMLMEMDADSQLRENEALRHENEQTKNWIMISTGFGICFLILSLVIFLYYRQKLKHADKLESAQKKADEAYAELKEMSGMKDKLFSILAHDLRSPLANTHQLLQLTKTGAIDGDIFSQLASELEVNLDYNRELLDNLLSWARSQMHGINVVTKRILIHDMINENTMLFAGIADKKQVKLVNQVSEDEVVMADENILKLALRNTISNAIKFSSPASSVYVSSQKINDKVIIEVKDLGVGISEDDKRNIFTLNTLSRRGTQMEKGAGIGLRITMEMLQRMGSKIWIESKAGKGTSVFIEVNAA